MESTPALVSDLNVSGCQIVQIMDGRRGTVVGRSSRRSREVLSAHLVHLSVAPFTVVNDTPSDLIVRGIDAACRAARFESAEPRLIPDDGETGDLTMAPAYHRTSSVGHTLPLSINASIRMESSSKREGAVVTAKEKTAARVML